MVMGSASLPENLQNILSKTKKPPGILEGGEPQMVSSYICELSLHHEVYHSNLLKKIENFYFVYKNFIMIPTIVLSNYPQLTL